MIEPLMSVTANRNRSIGQHNSKLTTSGGRVKITMRTKPRTKRRVKYEQTAAGRSSYASNLTMTSREQRTKNMAGGRVSEKDRSSGASISSASAPRSRTRHKNCRNEHDSSEPNWPCTFPYHADPKVSWDDVAAAIAAEVSSFAHS